MAKLAPAAAEQMAELVASHIPLGRMGRKWDIAQACLFLASPAAAFVSGHTLVVDGGEWMYRWGCQQRGVGWLDLVVVVVVVWGGWCVCGGGERPA